MNVPAGLAVTLASCVVLAASPGMAATFEPITIADVTRVDELGFACIEEADLEVAYAATGKKDALLPRTCLPKPCVRMIEEDELAQRIGREPTEAEWADYVARYAELCVAETSGAWPEDVMFANASAPVTDDTFWDGLAGVPLNEGVGSDVLVGLAGGAGSFTPGIIGPIAGGIPGVINRVARSPIRTSGPVIAPSFPIIDRDKDKDKDREDVVSVLPTPPGKPGEAPDGPETPDSPKTPETVTPPPPVTPVPLPASMVLLLGALGLTWGMRRMSGPPVGRP